MNPVQALAAILVRRTLSERSPIGRLRHAAAMPAPARLHPARPTQAESAWWSADTRWYAGDTPPRGHNRVTLLVHGAGYFAALEAALAGSQSYVYLADWCLSPYIPLDRSDPEALIRSRLLPLLSDVARRVPVRVLLWGGARMLFEPSVRTARGVQATFEREGRGDLQCRLDNAAHFTHDIHQKAVVVDGQVAFLGGVDLTTFNGDRWDTPAHPLRAGPNWHDMQVQIEGEAVADVEANFRQRWAAVTGDATLPRRAPAVDPAWQTPLQIVRTIPRGVYDFAPEGEFGIHYAYLEAIGRARRLIYLENQYFWAPDVLAALIAALQRPHDGPFRIVLLLPARAGDGKFDNDKHVQQLRAADGGRGQVGIYTLYTSGPNAGATAFTYRPIYIHAKVGIVDDEWLTIGSANLNNRGLISDGEMNAVVPDAGIARALRVALWAEHLGLPEAEVAAADPITLIDDVWRKRARANARIVKQAVRPLVGAVLPYTRGRMPGAWLLEDLQSLTFEH